MRVELLSIWSSVTLFSFSLSSVVGSPCGDWELESSLDRQSCCFLPSWRMQVGLVRGWPAMGCSENGVYFITRTILFPFFNMTFQELHNLFLTSINRIYRTGVSIFLLYKWRKLGPERKQLSWFICTSSSFPSTYLLRNIYQVPTRCWVPCSCIYLTLVLFYTENEQPCHSRQGAWSCQSSKMVSNSTQQTGGMSPLWAGSGSRPFLRRLLKIWKI